MAKTLFMFFIAGMLLSVILYLFSDCGILPCLLIGLGMGFIASLPILKTYIRNRNKE